MEKTFVKVRAIYADTDAMGIVYHANYIKWFEIGRTELFREMGITCMNPDATGVYFPLTKVYCHYILPVCYDDVVNVDTSIDYLRRASIRFVYHLRNENRDNLLTEGYTIHACTDGKGKIIRIPSTITDKIRLFYKNV